MKILSILLILFVGNSEIVAQNIAIANIRENILYSGIDNPLSIAAADCPCSKLVVKTTHGTVKKTGLECEYFFRGNPGPATITVYKLNGNKLNKLGDSYFRVKPIPDPIFRIGPYGRDVDSAIYHVVLAAQQFVRAELDNFGFDIRFNIVSFQINIINNDSCGIKHFSLFSNKVTEEVQNEFSKLKEGDIVVFDKIHIVGPDGIVIKIKPLVLTIAK